MSDAYAGIPEAAAIRAAVFDEVQRLRERIGRIARGEEANTFRWNGHDLWFDRTRWLVLTLLKARRLGVEAASTVSDTCLAENESLGARHDYARSPKYVDVWARWLAALPEAPFGVITGAPFHHPARVPPPAHPAVPPSVAGRCGTAPPPAGPR